MPNKSNIDAINLKEILTRVCRRARQLSLLVLRRACLLAAQAPPEAGISDADREKLRAIAGGNEVLARLHGDAKLDALAGRFLDKAEEEIHREESERLKRPVHRQTALQVARDTFLSAAAQVVSRFAKPASEAEANGVFIWYSRWLLDGTLCARWELLRATDLLDTADFRRELLTKLWTECPEEAGELNLPTAPGTGDLSSPPVKGQGEKHLTATDDLTGEEKALALLVKHPDWTDTRIAENVPCNRTTLYKWPRYVAAHQALKNSHSEPPRGSKDGETGDVEAWED